MLNKIVDTPELDVVRMVCFDQTGRVLLVKEFDDENWKLPGGKIHAGETILQAIQREAKEEIGVNIDSSMLQNYVKKTIPHSPNFRHIVSLNIDAKDIQKNRRSR